MDPLYEEIMYFITHCNKCYKCEIIYYDYLKNVNLEKINKDYISIMNGYRMRKYNYYIFHIIYNYIYIITKNEHKNIDKFKEIEEYFKLLLIKILTNNYNNIRFDITLSIIIIYYSSSINMIEYLETNGIIYDLDRINPNKYIWASNKQKKRAEYIYYRTKVLQMAWIWAVIKAQIHMK